MYLGDLLKRPDVVIKKVGKEKKKTLYSLIVLEWILLGIAVFIGMFQTVALDKLAIATIALIIVGILGTLFAAVLIGLTYSILGGKGGYREALNAVALGMFAPSVASIITSIFSLAGVAGIFVGFLVSIFLGVLGMATLVRSLKEYFRLDYLTIFIGLVLVLLPALSLAATLPSLFGVTPIIKTTQLPSLFSQFFQKLLQVVK